MKIALNCAIVVIGLLCAPGAMASNEKLDDADLHAQEQTTTLNPFQSILQQQEMATKGLNSWTQTSSDNKNAKPPVQAPLIGLSGSVPLPAANSPASQGMLNRYMTTQMPPIQAPTSPTTMLPIAPQTPEVTAPDLPVTPLNIPNTATVRMSDDRPSYVKLQKPKRAWGGTD